MASTKTKAAVKAPPSPAATLDDGPATAYAAAVSGMTETGPDVDIIGVRATPVEDETEQPPAGDTDELAKGESHDEDQPAADEDTDSDEGDTSGVADEDTDSDDGDGDGDEPDDDDDLSDRQDDGPGPSVDLDVDTLDIEMDEPEPWPDFADNDLEPTDTGAFDEPVVFDGLA